ncbi:MAG: hypothetical protein ACYC35_17100 [Pirellulales bacterium]
MWFKIVFPAFFAAALLAASPVSAQGLNASEQAALSHLNEWLSVDKLAVLLIFGTGLFAVLFTGTIKLIGALRGNSALSDEMLDRMAYIEERLASVEQALAASGAPAGDPATTLYTASPAAPEPCFDAAHRVS